MWTWLDWRGRCQKKKQGLTREGIALFGYLGGTLRWPQIEVKSAKVSECDSFLLCIDGLWENVDTQELEAVFAAKKLSRALRELVSAARSRGGAKCDNISVAAVRQAR